MKKTLFAALSLLLVLCFVAVNASAQSSITGNKVKDTPHNLQKATVSGMPLADLGEICVYCHTPHNSNTQITAPLWNRSTPAGPYTMYNSPTIDMDIATSPTGVSLACLSCHDNTIGLDQVVNIPAALVNNVTPGGAKIESCSQGCHVGTASGQNGINFEGGVIGTDLSNDHPVSVTYDPNKDPQFHAAASGKVGSLPLYGSSTDQVQCATCHNPHDNSNRPFLRVSNTSSALCLTCHDI